MKFGLHLPHIGEYATRDDILATAQVMEREGLDSVWVADHVAMPLKTQSVYPYRAGDFPFPKDTPWTEALTTLAFVAGVTSKVQLGTSVLVMPMRHPVLTAKVVATLDVLSGGRVVLGLGVGWWAEEFAALGMPFDARGRRCDESIEVMRGLWREREFSYAGRYYQLDTVFCEPKPVHRTIPILIGGGPASFDRIVRFGDGWHVVGSDGESLKAAWSEVLRRAEKVGRDPRELELTVATGLPSDRGRAIRKFRELKAAGVTHVAMNTRIANAGTLREIIEQFAREWRPEIDAD